MGKNNNIIEINGQRYDIHTGAVVSGPPLKHGQARPVVVDEIPVADEPSGHDVARQPAKHVQPHTPTRAHTLMRHAVKKPGPSLKQQLKAQGAAERQMKLPVTTIISKPAWHPDTKRLQHAARIARSQHINHFSAATVTKLTPAPVQPNAAAHTPHTATRHHAVTMPATPDKPTATAALLEHALQQATSHQQQPLRKSRHVRTKLKRRAGIAGVMGVLLLGGAVVQNLPNIRLQMASAKVGFSASLPDYQPAGFSLGKLNYGAGIVDAQFHSNSDDRRYSLIQKRSTWDNLVLRNTFVAPIDQNYKTIEAGGRTIYLYSQHNATWINDGFWYVIQANGSLSDHQLVELATSL